MIARILKWLMLLQVLAVLGVAYLAMQAWGVASPVLAVLLAGAMLLAVRALIVARNFWESRRLGSPVPLEYQLGAMGAARLFFGELCATLWTSSWGMLRPRLSVPAAPGRNSLPVLLIHGVQDVVIPVSRTWELLTVIPHADAHVFSQCGQKVASPHMGVGNSDQ